MNTLESLRQKLANLEKEIVETQKRLPAHSVKPPVMHDLPALEDERDEISKQIEQLKKKPSKPA